MMMVKKLILILISMIVCVVVCADNTKAITFLEKRLEDIRKYAETRKKLKECQRTLDNYKETVSNQAAEIKVLKKELKEACSRLTRLENFMVRTFALDFKQQDSEQLQLFSYIETGHFFQLYDVKILPFVTNHGFIVKNNMNFKPKNKIVLTIKTAEKELAMPDIFPD